MKKFLVTLFAVMMLATVAFASDITVTLDNEVIDCESYGSPATIVEGRTMVPLRAIFEALGASVDWNQSTRTVTSSLDDTTVKLTIGEKTLYKNGEAIALDVPAQIINSRTMVPARAVAEAYGVNVQWNDETRTVILISESENITPEFVRTPGTCYFCNKEQNCVSISFEGDVATACDMHFQAVLKVYEGYTVEKLYAIEYDGDCYIVYEDEIDEFVSAHENSHVFGLAELIADLEDEVDVQMSRCELCGQVKEGVLKDYGYVKSFICNDCINMVAGFGIFTEFLNWLYY